MSKLTNSAGDQITISNTASLSFDYSRTNSSECANTSSISVTQQVFLKLSEGSHHLKAAYPWCLKATDECLACIGVVRHITWKSVERRSVMARTADIQVNASSGRTTQELHRDALSERKEGDRSRGRGGGKEGMNKGFSLKPNQMSHIW